MIAAPHAVLDRKPYGQPRCRATESRTQLRDRVMNELSRLDRLIIVLHYYEQLSTHEISLVLDMPEMQIEHRRATLAGRLAQIMGV